MIEIATQKDAIILFLQFDLHLIFIYINQDVVEMEIEEIAEFLESPEAAAVAAPLALIAATPPPLPTFVPQGTPPPTAGGPAGGGGGGPGGTGGGGGGAGAAGGGILPGVALAVRTNLV